MALNGYITKNLLLVARSSVASSFTSSNISRKLFINKYQYQNTEKSGGKLANSMINTMKDDKTDEISSPQEYFNSRVKMIEEQRTSSEEPFPHNFTVTLSITDFIAKYKYLEVNTILQDVCVNVAGRVYSKRESGEQLIFYDIYDGGAKLQVLANARYYMDENLFTKAHCRIKRGDIIGIKGLPSRSKRGELSIIPVEIIQLAPCMHMLPDTHYGLKNQELRYRMRHLDLLMNPSTMNKLIVSSEIENFIRKYLEKSGFHSVRTPVLCLNPSGAAAKPFITHHNELDLDLFLRISPELYLKKLLIGGFNRVFEIGTVFRNEGIDASHNPEFTICEFYMAYADYEDMMKLVEDMISSMVFEICGQFKINYHSNSLSNESSYEIDFTPPFKRIVVYDELARTLDLTLPNPELLNSQEANEFFSNLVEKMDVECAPPRTTARLLDKLIGKFLEPKLIAPTFLIDHPEIMSPLAKWHRSKTGLTERFELFVGGKEIANAYSELNDPITQRRRFKDQTEMKIAGDDEAQLIDEDFCDALEYGLPPTAGCGIGMDRLSMLLTDSSNIRDVISFPIMRPIK